MYEPDQPLTELCERAWKILYRLGEKSQDSQLNDIMYYKFERYRLHSKNRFITISMWDQAHQRKVPIFTVDENGGIGSLDAVECAIALERFRAYTILDDLWEASE